MVLWEHPIERFLALISLIVIGVSLAVLAGKRLTEPPALILQTPPLDEENAPATLKVHIKGAVARPGLYSLPYGSRVSDAVHKAKALPQADLNALNLAQHLEDGQEVLVPEKKPVSKAVTLTNTGNQDGSDQKMPSLTTWGLPPRKVYLNSATQSDLESLPGIGPALAKRILDYRRKKGGFKDPSEIKEVPGIGPKKFEKIKPYIGL
ncbi:MAG: helix-hairpin-helix domain-containing protein [Armatimonadetes bacterium]|nr:helix-hairpin-helix domain-containing protein [Armatimonadota bacterium]MDW8120909.1 helix-hairpin-helix domain-containing protein [Armatimonadota bacterium]